MRATSPYGPASNHQAYRGAWRVGAGEEAGAQARASGYPSQGTTNYRYLSNSAPSICNSYCPSAMQPDVMLPCLRTTAGHEPGIGTLLVGTNLMVWGRLYSYRQHAVLILRVVIGVIFVLHGLSKFGIIDGGGFGGAVGVFRQADLPAPYITAPILAVIETAGGLALIFGLLARAFAALLAIVVTIESP